MAISIVAAWLVASCSPQRRHAGFWTFLVSNVLWVGWGWQAGAHALIALQVVLGIMNVRGMRKTDQG